MSLNTSAIAREISKDPVLKQALKEIHRAKYGQIASTNDVALMVEMLGLEQTIRRMDSRHAQLEFDGQFLRWVESGMVRRAWIASSGHPKYQGRLYQYLPDKGPIPEGRYVAQQGELQRWEDYSVLSRRACFLRAMGLTRFGGSWPGCKTAWGTRRIWLHPRCETVTLGRDNFSIHGGKYLGSAGCIDLGTQMLDFVDYFIKYGKEMEVDVRY